MKFNSAFLLLFVVIYFPLTNAQIVDNIETDFNSFLNAGGNLFSNYFSFDKSTVLNTAGSVFFISAGYTVDYNLKNLAGRNHSDFNNNLFSVDKVYGSGYTLIGIGGLYGYGLLFNNAAVRKIGLQTIEAVGYAGLVTLTLKSIIGRSRPYTNEGKSRFRPFNMHAAYTSFPSGHSTVVFAVSTVLANNTDNTILKILCYTAAFTVAGARIYHNAHWFSDVIAGGLIGHFVGDFVSSPNTINESGNKNFSFYFSPNSLGVSFSF